MSLANHPRVSQATRERIQALARQLGYQPNPYLVTLMRMRRHGKQTQERPVLALVCGQSTPQGWRDHPAPTLRQMREGALERAAMRGYRAQEFWLHRDGMSNERFSEMLYARGIQGMLLGPLGESGQPPTLHWPHFAAVSLSVPQPSVTITTVCNDHYAAALRAVRECHQLGYRRPGLVLRHTHRHRFQGRWEAGYLMAGEMLPEVKLAAPFYLKAITDEAALFRWIRRARPDVIITSASDLLPPILARGGWRVPDDLGLALLASPAPDDALSGIFQNGKMIGALAIDTLISLVERYERGLPQQATTLMVEGNWNPGRTVRALAP
jgi:DNA-binding LacI/PurR family transcriptional regulator